MKLSLCTAVLIAFATAPAVAGNIEPVVDPVVAAPAPPPSNWTGPYAGVQLGFADLTLDTICPRIACRIPITLSRDGFFGGLHAGYNWDRGGLIYGIEGDIDFVDIAFRQAKADSISRLRLRMGFDAGNAFVYGTAGAAYLSGGGGGIGMDIWGYVAGAGVDFKLSENWIVGADALYHDFDGVSPEGSVDGMTYRLRVSYRF